MRPNQKSNAKLSLLGQVVKCKFCGTRFRCPWWNLDKKTVPGLIGFQKFERPMDMVGYDIQIPQWVRMGSYRNLTMSESPSNQTCLGGIPTWRCFFLPKHVSQDRSSFSPWGVRVSSNKSSSSNIDLPCCYLTPWSSRVPDHGKYIFCPWTVFIYKTKSLFALEK